MMAEGTESEMFETRRVSMRIPRWVSFACFFLGIAIFAVSPRAGSGLVSIALIAAAFVGLYLSVRLPPRERAVRIHVDRDGVRAGARMLIRRSAVRNTTIAEIAGGGAVLTLRSATRSVTFRMSSAAEAARVMARL